jgi:hypothetical protein
MIEQEIQHKYKMLQKEFANHSAELNGGDFA